MSSFLEYALQYAGRSWRVFPCQPRGKKPLTKHGFKDATVNPKLIEGWWGTWPDANIGIATGAMSGLLVVDLDGEAGIATMQSLMSRHGEHLPNTLVCATGRGCHLYFDLTGGGPIVSSVGTGEFKGVDVRADGGYVIAPPSIHPSGAIYRWVEPLRDPMLTPLFHALLPWE